MDGVFVGKFYSGLIVDPDVEKSIYLYPRTSTGISEIQSNLAKIEKLPWFIRDEILKIPQFEIFFENNIPYYTTQFSDDKKELPCSSWYYDPVMDTRGYELISDIAYLKGKALWEDYMIRTYGKREVFGTAHIMSRFIEEVLYNDYGIRCIHNPMVLNRNLYAD